MAVRRYSEPSVREITIHRSLGTRLAVMVSASAATIFLLGTLLAYWWNASSFARRSDDDLVAQAKLVRGTIAQFDRGSQNAAVQLMGALKALFPDGIQSEKWKSSPGREKDVPILKASGVELNDNPVHVDEFTRLSEGKSVAAIFARMGDDFVSITSSVKREDGGRLTGFRLPVGSPEHEALLGGRGWTGKRTLAGRE